MLHVLTVAFRERRTVSAVVVWISHTAKSANVIFPFVASTKYSVKSARYIYKSYYFYTLPSCVFYILYKLDYYFTYRYRYTLSRLCVTELWKAAHQTTYSTKQRRVWNFVTCNPIRHLFRNDDQHPSTRHQRHRSTGLAPTRVLTRLFFYSLFFYSR